MSAYTNICNFWEKFLEIDEKLRTSLLEQREESYDIIEQFDQEALRICGSHFFCEYSYGVFEMTFDTGPNKTSQYLALLCSECAPEAIKKNWTIHSCLQAMSAKAVQADLRIKEDDYYLNDFTVFYQVNEKNKTIDCKLYCPGYSLIGNTERKKEMSMYLIELAIGECAYEAYLSSVDYLDQPNDQWKFCNLIDYYETIMDIADQKDWPSYTHPTQIHSIYKPYKEFADDSLRKDMKLIFTTHPLLIEESIEGQKDVLSDLQVKDGCFAYIYFMNIYNNKEDALLRQELSKKLNHEMNKIHAGKVIGGAIGKSYSYIDWIIFDEEQFLKAFESIKKQLKVALYYQKF